MNPLLIEGAIANIGEKDWKQDIAIKILEDYLEESTVKINKL